MPRPTELNANRRAGEFFGPNGIFVTCNCLIAPDSMIERFEQFKGITIEVGIFAASRNMNVFLFNSVAWDICQIALGYAFKSRARN